MGSGQCLSELGSPLAGLELNNEALAGSNRERKVTLSQAKCLACLGNGRPKLLRILNSHLTDREDNPVSATMVLRILPIGMNTPSFQGGKFFLEG